MQAVQQHSCRLGCNCAPAPRHIAASLTARVTFINGSPAARVHLTPLDKTFSGQRCPSLHRRSVRSRALFGFDDKKQDARKEIYREQSSLVSEELILFIFQLELDTQLQRALNNQAYETAKQVREKRQEIDQYVEKLRQQKTAKGDSGAEPEMSAVDFATEGIRIKSEMQRAAQEERYADAAKFRDLLAELDRKSKKAQAISGEWNVKVQPALRLGQRVKHKKWGWRGAVAGWDVRCCETDEWAAKAGVQELAKGVEQPFYYVLVDERDWQMFDDREPPCAYVAEELLSAPELGENGMSWIEANGPDEMQHPFCLPLFLGQDARGDLLPCRQLRSKYNAQRRDVTKPDDKGNSN